MLIAIPIVVLFLVGWTVATAVMAENEKIGGRADWEDYMFAAFISFFLMLIFPFTLVVGTAKYGRDGVRAWQNRKQRIIEQRESTIRQLEAESDAQAAYVDRLERICEVGPYARIGE